MDLNYEECEGRQKKVFYSHDWKKMGEGVEMELDKECSWMERLRTRNIKKRNNRTYKKNNKGSNRKGL